MDEHSGVLGHIFHAHEPSLAALSIALVVIASFVSLELAGRIRIAAGADRWRWVILAAVTMGGGIWAMHFVAITSIRFPSKPVYDIPLTLFSMLVAIVFSGVGFYLVFWKKLTWGRLAAGGTIMGLGVVAMHYSGMAAIAVPMSTSYRPDLVAVSVVIALVAAGAALWLATNVRRTSMRVASAFVMGAAISGMHFTGMAAYQYSDAATMRATTFSGYATGELTIPIALTTLFILLGGLLLVYFDQMARRINDSALREFGLSAFVAPTFDAALEQALRAAREVLGLDVAVVETFDLKHDKVSTAVLRALGSVQVETQRIKDLAVESLFLAVMRQREPLKASRASLLADARNLQPWFSDDINTGIIVPSISEANTVVVIGAFSNEARDFTSADERFLLTIADMLAMLNDRENINAELRLREHALQSITQGITISDVRGDKDVITYANPAFSKMVGHPVEQIVGSSPKRFIVEKGSEQAYAEIAQAKENKLPMRLEVNMRRIDGSTFVNEVTGSPMIDGSGEMTHSVLMHEDMTEMKVQEGKLRDLQRLETVGQLAGNVARDFNNLLTVIKANADDLTEELKASADLGLQAAMILEAADRGAALVRQLIAFSYREKSIPQKTDLNAMVEAVVGLVRPTLPPTIGLQLRKGSEVPAVHIDAGKLQTALLNVVASARDAMTEGGALTIETSHAVLDGDVADGLGAQAGAYAMIRIADTGIGMEPDILKRAFDPFVTATDTDLETVPSLSLVSAFVRQSGGQVKIHQERFHGTTVTIYLPATRAATHAPATAGRDVSQDARVLLVESDPLVRKSVGRKLQSMGYEVQAVAAATDAVDALETGAYALVLTDVMAPGVMTGADLAREIERRWPMTRVLLTSDYVDAAVLDQVHIQKGVKLLPKPYTNESLSEAIFRLMAA